MIDEAITNELKSMLHAYKVNTDNYTDEDLNTFIKEALRLIDSPLTTPTDYVDYVEDFNSKHYITDYYPILNLDNVRIYCNNKLVTPRRIKRDGIIYFNTPLSGTLEVEYKVGLDSYDILESVLPIACYLIRGADGQNISSVSEGDVNVSYDTTTYATQINGLIEHLKNKYGARVKLL